MQTLYASVSAAATIAKNFMRRVHLFLDGLLNTVETNTCGDSLFETRDTDSVAIESLR